jgi:aryl-alcohol dehydrogenase-like predicted oxidoreductase
LFIQQNTLEEAVALLDKAFDEYGINFLDTAEIYPAPIKAETQGSTDKILAQFLKGRRREDVILATKVTGRANHITWLPRRKETAAAALTKDQIVDSVDASLERLGTDYIDLLQLHWPGMYRGVAR